MPAPTTVAELLGLVQKSGVVDASRLAEYVGRLQEPGSRPAEPKPMAAQLVRDGVLTVFQAEQLLHGKWKRFTIGQYKVLERLGSGGMGQVYLCEHRRMRTKVAVKVLPTAKSKDDSALQRFEREARAAGLLDHPNLVQAYNIDKEVSGPEVLHYLVMEYVDGASLQEIVKRSGPLDPVRACHYVYQAALGLQYAYEVAELVHRDVKPGNIMVDRRGNVKVLDMGLARFFNDETDVLTKKFDESILGTADYLSPEQATDSHGVDVRADIYSLGATFYFMLTGHPPFPDGTVAQKLIWHQTRQPKPVRLVRPDVPEVVAAILERMMMKDQAARYQTPAELAGALAPYVQDAIPPPDEAELPRLSPAVLGDESPTRRLSAAATSPAGRWGSPVPTAASAAGVAAVAAAPSRTAPSVVAARKSTHSQPAETPTARRDEANPFANLLGSKPFPAWPTPPTNNVYATAAARAEAASLPAVQTSERPRYWLSAVGSFATVLAIAGMVFAVWRIVLG